MQVKHRIIEYFRETFGLERRAEKEVQEFFC